MKRLSILILLAVALPCSEGCASFFVVKAGEVHPVGTWHNCLHSIQPVGSYGQPDAPDAITTVVKILLYIPGFICDTVFLPFVFLVDGYFKLIYADWPCMGIKRAMCFYPAWFGS